MVKDLRLQCLCGLVVALLTAITELHNTSSTWKRIANLSYKVIFIN